MELLLTPLEETIFPGVRGTRAFCKHWRVVFAGYYLGQVGQVFSADGKKVWRVLRPLGRKAQFGTRDACVRSLVEYHIAACKTEGSGMRV